MARLTQPPRRSFEDDPEDLAAYDAVIARRMAIGMGSTGDPALGAPDMGEYFGALLTSPRMCAIAARMGNFVRTAGEREDSYQHWERELVDQVLSADFATNVVQALHIPDGIAAGVRLEAIEALRHRHEAALTDEERQLVDYVRAVITGTVQDAQFEAMRTRMGDRGLVDYTAFILWLQWIIRMMQALGVHDPPDEEIDALITGLRDGTVAVPDHRERLG